MAALLLVGCVGDGARERSSPQVKDPEQNTVHPRIADSRSIQGTVAPQAKGIPISDQTVDGRLTFPHATDTAILLFNVSKAPLVSFRVRLWVDSSENAIIDTGGIDHSFEISIVGYMAHEYKINVAPFSAETGFDWNATIIQFVRPDNATGTAPP